MSHNSRDRDNDTTRFDEPAATRGGGERSRLITIDSRDPEPAEPRPALLAGTTLGPYRINRLLGKGGMGEVYEAEHVETGRHVALKVLSHSLASAVAVSRFLREGRLAAAVSHPNSVYVYGSHEIDGVPMIAMELVAGGTLQELVEQNGPMAPARAVDAILQVVAGLEAAETVGVLHRDVKPSNCFIDANGVDVVKVGDFGLSMSTMGAEDQTQLTMLGTFLGTPAFASPEQVSGAQVDLRSDIYSVGATLYFLLAARTPFPHTGVMQVFAAVLKEDPVSPRLHAPAASEALGEVVLRCLRKDPAARYATYADLRRALLPFSSRTAEAAPMRLRFLAWLIDVVVQAPVLFLVEMSLGGTTSMSLRMSVIDWTLGAAYYSVLEGIWGASVGKRICGLRVIGPSQQPPGVPRAMLRTVALQVITNVPSITMYLWLGTAPKPQLTQLWLALFSVLFGALPWVVARKRNGFRALHDWMSGTRVIRLATESRARASQAAPVGDASSPANDRIGEYVCEARLWSNGDEELIAARDEMLRRPVWIHRVAAGTPPLSAARQNIARVTRPRVLASVRGAADSFDVYEAVDGEPLGSDQPWNIVRQWLTDLTSEIGAALDERTMPPGVTLDHVCVTATGGIRLLDFPSVRHAQAREIWPVHDVATAQAFIGRVAARALGEDGTGGTAHRRPLPLSARKTIDALQRGAFQTVDELRAALAQTMDALTTVSRGRRLAALAVAAALPILVMGAILLAGYQQYRVRTDPTSDEVNRLLARLDRMEKDTTSADGVRQRDALRVYVGDRFGGVMSAPGFWTGRGSLSRLKATGDRAREAALAAAPADRQRAATDAARVLADLERRAASRLPPVLDVATSFTAAATIILAGVGLISILLSVFFRGPAGLRLVGLTVATTDGAALSRGRAAWRGVICWSPVLAGALAGFALKRFTPDHPLAFGAIAGVGLLILIVGVALTIAVPERGLQDRLARTMVVPF